MKQAQNKALSASCWAYPSCRLPPQHRGGRASTGEARAGIGAAGASRRSGLNLAAAALIALRRALAYFMLGLRERFKRGS